MPIKPIPFVGASYELGCLNQSAQRCINWFVQKTEQGGKTQSMLLPTPGLVQIDRAGNGPIHAILEETNGNYVISGHEVYYLERKKQAKKIGDISKAAKTVSLASNGTQVMIVDGITGWIVQIKDNTIKEITDASFPKQVTFVVYLDSYFVVGGDGSGFFHISAIGDGTKWKGADLANAEGDPDPLIAGIVDHRELWLFGTQSYEIWTNTGDAGFPLERSGNAFGEIGCAAPHSITKLDNSIIWLGKDRRGDGMIWKANGYQPQRLSNHAIEAAISGYSRINDAKGYAYQLNGHACYVLTFPSADVTWVFDAATGLWHEWLAFDAQTGEFHRHRSNCHAMYGRCHVVGDYENGNIYRLDTSTYTDNGAPIKRLRRTIAQQANGQRLFFNTLSVDIESGVGEEREQTSPQMLLRYSDDGGHTWSAGRTAVMGKQGQYGTRCQWHRLGTGRQRVWEISITDPVKAVVLGATLDFTLGAA